MAAQLVVVFVMISLDCCVFDCAVHPLDLTVRPWVVWLSEAMFDLVRGANHVEPHRP